MSSPTDCSFPDNCSFPNNSSVPNDYSIPSEFSVQLSSCFEGYSNPRLYPSILGGDEWNSTTWSYPLPRQEVASLPPSHEGNPSSRTSPTIGFCRPVAMKVSRAAQNLQPASPDRASHRSTTQIDPNTRLIQPKEASSTNSHPGPSSSRKRIRFALDTDEGTPPIKTVKTSSNTNASDPAQKATVSVEELCDS